MSHKFDAIKEVLDNQFPNYDNEVSTWQLFSALTVDHGGYRVTKRSDQLKALDKLEKACKSAQSAYRDLDSEVSLTLQRNSDARWNDYSFHPKELREFLETLPLERHGKRVACSPDMSAKQLVSIADALKDSFKAARDCIASLEDAGRRNWRRTAAISICREIWEDRTGKRLASLNEASDFGVFCKNIFEVAQLGSPRNAMDMLVDSERAGKII